MSRLYEQLSTPAKGHGWRDIILLTLLFGMLFLGSLGSAPLIDPDEGRYAEIPREMLEQRDFVTPTLNYVKYFEKPPLLYWLNAGSMALFGKNEFSARLPAALAGLCTILLTYAAGRRIFNRKTAVIAALILGTSAGFFLQSRIILTDMLLTFCLSAALFSFLRANEETGHTSRRSYWLFFVCCGLAVLTKGLIGIVLPAGIVFWFVLLGRRWRLLREIPWISGLLFFAAITVPWFVLVSRTNPEFPYFFFIHEHFQRYTSTVHHRSQPFWFFLPILLLTLFPWSLFLWGGLKRAWQQRHRGKSEAQLFLLVWPIVILLFFSFSSSKLIPYILPTLPPLALLIAHRLAIPRHAPRSEASLAQYTLALLLLVIGTALAFVPFMTWLPPFLHQSGQTGRELAAMLTGPTPVITMHQTLPPGILMIVIGLLLLWTARIRSNTLMLGLLCCFGILLELASAWGFSHYAAGRLSTRPLTEAALRNLRPDTILVQSGPHQSMNFYTGKRLVTTGDPDELSFGSKQGDQRNWFINQEQFVELWRSPRHVMFVIPRHEQKQYDAAIPGFSDHLVADNGSLLLLSNR